MNNFKSLQEKILNLRSSGKVYCEFSDREDADIKKSLYIFAKKLGFSVESNLEELNEEVDNDLALRITTRVLHNDLAYFSEIMPIEQARGLAKDFHSLFSTNTRFFTNANFKEKTGLDKKDAKYDQSWPIVPEKTFDTGIFIIDEKNVGCIWVADED